MPVRSAPPRGFLERAFAGLAAGEFTPAGLLELCLERIRERDDEVRAWVVVAPQPPTASGALDGIPFGVKDIFETRGLATEYGSPVYAGRVGVEDAALVAALRRAGGVLLGKTHTTAFAYFDPAPTRNPRDLDRTPGGSSSGSAAAVAAGMVPFALGTQTMGSVIRPASFCGITGFKPTYGLLPLEGVLPFAPSLDTAGLFTETAAGMKLLWERMGKATRAEPATRLGVLEPWVPIESGMRQAYEWALGRLRAAGWVTDAVTVPVDLAAVQQAVELVTTVEGARTHRARWEQFGERIGARLAALIRRGLAIADQDYLDALEALEIARRRMLELWADYPVLLSPAVRGPAPGGLASTGDPALNAPWTGLRGPVLTLPMNPGDRLPLGLQMAAPPGADGLLLETAVRLEQDLVSNSL
jgi:Asp-tRNA(Asn)/Glu-tRNA(Gln) amidotransferase A subunit family amidase